MDREPRSRWVWSRYCSGVNVWQIQCRLDFKELHVLAREVCVCVYMCVCVCVCVCVCMCV